MKNFLFIGSALGVFLLAGAANAELVEYKATLSGDQEVPNKVTTTANGTATFTFNTETKKLFGTITYEDLSGEATGAHIHKEACGKAGGIIGDFGAEGASIASPIETDEEGSQPLDDDQVAALEAGELYVNIHTAENDKGEIRGQIYRANSTEKCPAGTVDGGTSSSSSSSSSSGSTSSSSGSTSSSGTSGTAPKSTEDSGCSTTGSSAPGSGLALALGLGLAMAAVTRARRNKK